MKKFMLLTLVLVLTVGIMAAAPEKAEAKMTACEVAAGYSWHSTFHNIACGIEYLMDNWQLKKSAPVIPLVPIEVPTIPADIASAMTAGDGAVTTSITVDTPTIDVKAGYVPIPVPLLL